VSGEHKQFISEEDEELRRIKEKKLKELMRLKGKKQEMSAKPVPVTDSHFSETVDKHALALIDCWAPWCGPCVVISPIVEELAKEYAGKVLFGKLNVDENPRTAGRFQIFGIPTLLIIRNGKEVDRIVGLVPKDQIEARLKKHLE
jgi:thioredoxin 1